MVPFLLCAYELFYPWLDVPQVITCVYMYLSPEERALYLGKPWGHAHTQQPGRPLPSFGLSIPSFFLLHAFALLICPFLFLWFHLSTSLLPFLLPTFPSSLNVLKFPTTTCTFLSIPCLGAPPLCLCTHTHLYRQRADLSRSLSCAKTPVTPNLLSAWYLSSVLLSSSLTTIHTGQ